MTPSSSKTASDQQGAPLPPPPSVQLLAFPSKLGHYLSSLKKKVQNRSSSRFFTQTGSPRPQITDPEAASVLLHSFPLFSVRFSVFRKYPDHDNQSSQKPQTGSLQLGLDDRGVQRGTVADVRARANAHSTNSLSIQGCEGKKIIKISI